LLVVYLNQKQLTSQLIFIPDCVFFVAFSRMRLNEFTKKKTPFTHKQFPSHQKAKLELESEHKFR